MFGIYRCVISPLIFHTVQLWYLSFHIESNMETIFFYYRKPTKEIVRKTQIKATIYSLRMRRKRVEDHWTQKGYVGKKKKTLIRSLMLVTSPRNKSPIFDITPESNEKIPADTYFFYFYYLVSSFARASFFPLFNREARRAIFRRFRCNRMGGFQRW